MKDKTEQIVTNSLSEMVAGVRVASMMTGGSDLASYGGIAYNKKFNDDIEGYVGSLTEYHVRPGENEMEALAEGIFRVLDKVEEALEY